MKTKDIADLLRSDLIGDPGVEITGIADLRTAGGNEIAFLDRSLGDISSSAGCLIVPLDFAAEAAVPLIRSDNPKLAFSVLAPILNARETQAEFRHPIAAIDDTAVLGSEVSIAAFVSVGANANIGDHARLHTGVSIGENVRIGKSCVLHPNAAIADGCTIGDNVILHSGVVIGTDGFGYVQDEAGRHVKFPQVGTVVIEDNVEIGANSCIDRGALGETRIGEGTKIDNLVQIAHNVQIGKRVIIAAQTGISGSTVIEDDCVIGGQVGMGDHARILSGAVIGSQAGVLPGKIVRPGVWWGTPIQPLDEYKRQNAHVKGLSRLKDEIKALKQQITELSKAK